MLAQLDQLRTLVAYAGTASGSSANAVSVNTAGGAGFQVGTDAAPYAVQAANRYIEFDADSGATQTCAQLAAGTFVGERHTFWAYQWSGAGNPLPRVKSVGCVMTTINGGASAGTTADQTLPGFPSFVTFEWDGTRWMQVG